jgi:hypothetical protein
MRTLTTNRPPVASLSSGDQLQSPAVNAAKPGKAAKSAEEPLRFAHVDEFTGKHVDVNGDGVSDVSHGRMTEIYAEDAARQAGRSSTFKRYEVADGGFGALAKDIQAGAKFDGINVSQSLNIPEYSADGKPQLDPSGFARVVPATPDNLARAVYPGDAVQQKALVEAARKSNFSQQQVNDIGNFCATNEGTRGLFLTFGELAATAKEKGIPLTLSAGNSKREFNAFSLFDGVTTVGSSNADGKKSAYSSETTRSDALALGVYNTTKVKGGVDVTGDQKADVFDRDLSKSDAPRQLDKVIGRKASDVAATSKDYQAVAKYYATRSNFFTEAGDKRPQHLNQPNVVGKVFNTERLAKAIEAEGGTTSMHNRLRQATSDKGGFVTFTNNPDMSGLTYNPLRVSKGVVVFDPDGSKTKAIGFAQGTSFSAPVHMVHLAASNAGQKS